MALTVGEVRARSILTRASGFLRGVSSHSLQPYRGCTFGRSLCGVGCYVRHNRLLTRGEPWGSFLEARVNAAELYRRDYRRERAWARRRGDPFGVFMSSSTDPFVPQEAELGVSRRVLEAMVERPPDVLILQTHTHRVADHLETCLALAERTDLRVHVSIEGDRDRLPGLPPPASPVARRFEAVAQLKRAGLHVVVTASPLLPLRDARGFVERVADSASALVVDHFVGGDGSPDGSRTRHTALPGAMAAVDPESVTPAYRDAVVALAREIMPGRVGVGPDGFAGRWLP